MIPKNDEASESAADSIELESSCVIDQGFDSIPADLCIKILREGTVGVLALIGSDAPDLRPVNFAISRRRIVMRTAHGRIFDGARQEEAASFVITAFDQRERSGRSIIVTGKLSVCDPTDSAIRAKVGAWSKADRPERVLLSIERITGRRLSSRPWTD
jgi:nitroimidazol reductase NimA-like FMN-containing flavoprotein (pyridoxamine 5'-phosphate oxidase superfamily)